MRILTLNETGLVAGGRAMARPEMIRAPVGGYGGIDSGNYGGYYGSLGGYTGAGSYSGDSDILFNAQDAGTAVESGDEIAFKSNSQCVLESPSGTEVAVGVFEMVSGTFAQVMGVVAILGTDGLATIPGVATFAFGSTDVALGGAKLRLKCKPGTGGN